MDYSTKNITLEALDEIKEALSDIDYGSVEIYVTNSEITQITKRTIKKTSKPLSVSSRISKIRS